MRPRSVSGETDDARGRTAHHEGTCEALDEPGAEGVEAFELREVDIDASRLSVAPGGSSMILFELGGMLGRPGARGCKRQVFALGGDGEPGSVHGFLPAAGAGAHCNT